MITKIENRIEINSKGIKLNGVFIDPTHMEIEFKSDGFLNIKLELEGRCDLSNIDSKY